MNNSWGVAFFSSNIELPIETKDLHKMIGAQVLFVHIPKTAGTSLWSMLSTRFDQDAILKVNQTWAQWPQLVKHVDAYRLVGGHVGYGFVTAFNRLPKVITFLRNPIERALSAYSHLRHLDSSLNAHKLDRDHREARARVERNARALPLLDFLRNEPQAAVHLGNLQTWYLASNGVERPPYYDIRAIDLERAKENLSRCDFIGVTERFAESMEMLCRTLQWEPFTSMHHANATPSRTGAELDSPTLDALRRFTEFDEELYRFANELVERRWRALRAEVSATHSRATTDMPPATSLGIGGFGTFTFDRAIPGDGWYGPERLANRWMSWTGPGHDAWIRLAAMPRTGGLLRIHVLHALKSELLSSTKVLINDIPLVVCVRAEGNGHVLEAELPTDLHASAQGSARLVIRVPELYRPCDVDSSNPDSRRLGLAISSICLVPRNLT